MPKINKHTPSFLKGIFNDDGINKYCQIGQVVILVEVNYPPYSSALKLVVLDENEQVSEIPDDFSRSISRKVAKQLGSAIEKGADELMKQLGEIEEIHFFEEKINEINNQNTTSMNCS